jgi:hypothetical protein
MDKIPPILRDKLLILLHQACCEMRTLVQIRQHQRVYDLADTVEFIPEEMFHWRTNSWDIIRSSIETYQAKYPNGAHDYLSLLHMSDQDFTMIYSPKDDDQHTE